MQNIFSEIIIFLQNCFDIRVTDRFDKFKCICYFHFCKIDKFMARLFSLHGPHFDFFSPNQHILLKSEVLRSLSASQFVLPA